MMGGLISTQARRAKKRSDIIDEKIRENGTQFKRHVKILLLGLEDSGTSTIMNQMKIIHQGGFSETELAEYRSVIYDNLLDSAQSVLRYMKSIGMECVDYENRARVEKVLGYQLDTSNGSIPFDIEIAEAIHYVWNDPVVSKILDERSSNFYLMDSAPYFFGEVMRIGSPGYLPSERDIVNARDKTEDITETRFHLGQIIVHIFDISGKIRQWRKWINYFESVTSIIFCASLSDYDQMSVLQKNRLLESMILFESVVNSRWFLRTSIILLLTNIDVFKQKIPKVPLEKYFPEYTGGSDINKAAKYILWKFMQANRARLSVYPHLTQVTDATNIRLVFSAVKETILQNTLKDSGIL